MLFGVLQIVLFSMERCWGEVVSGIKICKDNFVRLISLKMLDLYQALMLMQYQMQQLANNILTMQKNPNDIKDMLLNREERHLW